MKTREQKIAEAKEAVEEARLWRENAEEAGYEVGSDAYETWKEKARVALAKVGAVLEEAHEGEGREACERACNAVRAEFGLGAMEEMPWDGVNELVGWDVVIEREG